MRGDGAQQVRDAGAGGGVDGAHGDDLPVALRQVRGQRGGGGPVAAGGHHDDRRVRRPGRDRVQPWHDLSVGPARPGAPHQDHQRLVGEVEPLRGPVLQLAAEVPEVQVHADAGQAGMGQMELVDVDAVGHFLAGIEGRAAQLLDQRGLADRGLAHDQDLRAPQLDRGAGQGLQVGQDRPRPLGRDLGRRAGQLGVAVEAEGGQAGELPEPLREGRQPVGGEVEGGQLRQSAEGLREHGQGEARQIQSGVVIPQGRGDQRLCLGRRVV